MELIQSRNVEFERLQDLVDAERLERLGRAIYALNFIGAVIYIGLSIYFLYRVVRNRKEAQSQKYITFLFVINIIAIIFNGIAVIGGSWITLVAVGINVLMLVGTSKQRNV